ncbi:MAG: hypothetical protein U9R72_05340 [Chloroflexota bacterium]|nr:hypothetical protein [Chloroflexota bacterium]
MDEMIQQTNKPTNQPTDHRTRRRITPWLIIGGGLLLVLLVGAAFVRGRLLARQPQEGWGGTYTGEGGEGGVHHFGPVERPEEYPEEEPDVCGLVTRRDGNSLFLGTGSYSVSAGESGAPEMDYEGPEVEVVVTHDTEIYAETIEMDFEADTMQRTLEPATLDDIVQATSVQVWGEKRGDRVTARVLVYQSMGPRGRQP